MFVVLWVSKLIFHLYVDQVGRSDVWTHNSIANDIWMCKPNSADWQLIVCLIKGKLRHKKKDVKRITCPSGKQSAVNSDPWKTLRRCQSVLQRGHYLSHLCHTNLKTQWSEAHSQPLSHHEIIIIRSLIVSMLLAGTMVKTVVSKKSF